MTIPRYENYYEDVTYKLRKIEKVFSYVQIKAQKLWNKHYKNWS